MILRAHPRNLTLAALFSLPLIGCNCDPETVTRVGAKLVVPAELDFGDVLIGQLETRSLEIKNDSDANILVTRISLPADFSGDDYQFVVNTASFTLRAHSTTDLDVKFQPFAGTSSITSTFTILTDSVDNDGQAIKADVTLKGRGVLNALEITPHPVDFGTVIIGGFEEREFQVKNLLSGGVQLFLRPGPPGESPVINRSGNGSFLIVSPVEPDSSLIPGGGKLAPGESLTIRTRYIPNFMPAPEDDKGRAKIAACVDSICDQNVDFIARPSLTGIECTPQEVNFGAINPGRILSRTVTCTNQANHALRIRGWGLAAGTASEFGSDAYNGIPSMIQPMEAFTINTEFKPTPASLDLGERHGELTVSAQTLAGANLHDVRVGLRGTAGGPGINVVPGALSFGQVALGTSSTRRVLVSNVGYAPLTISSIQIADRAFTTDAQPMVIDVDRAQTFEIHFTPTAEQAYATTMKFESDDGITPIVTVNLTATGVALPPCVYSVMPSPVTWGIIAQSESETHTMRITNTGADRCVVNSFEIVPQGSDFHLEVASDFEAELPPGMSTDVPINFAPTHEGPQMGAVAFYVSDPANSNPHVELSGLGLPPCGNGTVDPGEECDDGNPFNGDLCDNNCTIPGCGNGALDPGEQCDDGNSTPFDGCEPNCIRTGICGNFNLEIGEECDDGNLMPYDGCDPLCYIEDCGNGTLDVGELCDDGNRVNGDGCSATCQPDFVSNVDVLTFGQGGMRSYAPTTGGSGMFTVAGVSGPVSSALLFWNGPTNSNDFLAGATVNFNGNYVTGVNVGFSSDNCWGFQNSQAYRADVTAYVTGDGVYTLDDFVKPGVDVNGVSLIVFFDDGDPSNNFDIGIFGSNDSNISSPFDPADWDQTYMVQNFMLGGSAFMELHVGDGQSFPDAPVLIDGVTVYDVPGGGLFAGNSVPNADPMAVTIQNGGLWDIHRVDITSVMTGGPQSLHMTSTTNNDCLSLVVTLILTTH